MPTSQTQQPAALLYQQVAERVIEMIRAKVLRPGDRIPSIRKMSRQMSVAISTVMEAYHSLEDKGIIEARPQSGYYVRPPHARRMCQINSPPEPAMQHLPLKANPVETCNFLCRTVMAAQGIDVVALGGALPDAEFLPTQQLNRILARVVRENGRAASMYAFSPGHEGLRDAVARRAMEAGCTLTSDDIVITTGATEALMLSMKALTKPGDIVAVESPCYFGVLHLLKCLDLRVVEVCTDPRDGVSLESLERTLNGPEQVAALVLNPNCHNPLGFVMSDNKKRQIAEMMEAYDVPLIEDDAAGELAFQKARPRSIKSFDRKGNFILCGAFSKTISPGFRVGWAAPGRYREQIQELKLAFTLASNTAAQMALAWYLNTGGFERHLRRLRRIYEDQLRMVGDVVRRTFPAGTKATRPAGGHWLWIEMPPEVDSRAFHEQALKEGVSFAPGSVFSPTGRYKNFMRLNGAIPWRPKVERAIGILGRLAKEELNQRT